MHWYAYQGYGTYLPLITVKIGNLKPVEVTLDTGSTGLRLNSMPGIGAAQSGTTCYGNALGRCLQVAYDTGQGTPFVNAKVDGLPTITYDENSKCVPTGVLVEPGVRLGFGTPAGPPVASVVAGTRCDDYIPYAPQNADGSPVISASIEAMFDRAVVFDHVNGRLSISPLP